MQLQMQSMDTAHTRHPALLHQHPVATYGARLGSIARWAPVALVAGLAFATLPAQAGVGLTRLMAGDLPVTLVYPSDAPATKLVQGPFELQVALDAEPTPAATRRALVVLSHGTGGSPTSDHEMAATLARAGFVVAQPVHAADNFQDMSKAGPAAWRTRPMEVSRVIDFLAAHPVWGARVQTGRVGVHGMSAGGGTALVMAGAQWSTLLLARHCMAQGDDDFGFCFNGLPTAEAQAARRATYQSLRGAPDAYLPAELKAWHGGRSPADSSDPRPDPRVAAVSVAVPVAAMFSTDSLARIAVPVAVLRADKDQMLLPRWHADHLLRHCSHCTLLAQLDGAAHMDLVSPWPETIARAVAAQQARGGLPEPGFDARTRAAAFQAVAAFFKQQLLR